MQLCVRLYYKHYSLAQAKLKNPCSEGFGEHFQLSLINSLGAAIQKSAASSEQRPEVEYMTKKKLTTAESSSPKITAFCIAL